MKFYLLLCYLLTNFTFAQGEQKKTCRILFLERPDDAPQTLYLFDGKSSQEVDLPKMNFSIVYELNAGATNIALLNYPVEKQEDVPTGSPNTIIHPNVVDFYLLVAVDVSKKNTLLLKIVDVGNEKLRPGQMMWFNLTDLHIGGKLGSETIHIKPRSEVVMSSPTRENAGYPVKLAYRKQDEPHLYPICETQWSHNAQTRSLAFVYLRENVRTPRVLVFPDYRAIDDPSVLDPK